MKLWNRAEIAIVTAVALGAVPVASMGQVESGARDLRTSCLVSEIPALQDMSVSWTGDCVGGLASGVGNVIAFSHGELRYILRGQFVGGRMKRQDQMRQCVDEQCSDQVAAVILREHAAWGRQKPTVAVAAAGAADAADQSNEIRAQDAVYRGSFKGDPKSGLVSGQGRVEFFDGRSFIGRLENGKKSGPGTYVWIDGQRYVGDWRDDVQEGMGDWTTPRGDHYVGEYRRGKRQGQGVMTFANKIEYKGDWLNDSPSGTGTFRFPNQDTYEGQVLEGERTGRGTLTHQNGDRYTGQWLRGLRQGTGVAEWKNGQRYEGQWQDDQKHGAGRMVFADGGSYDGQWLRDRATGRGTLTFASGDTYVGEVLDGVPHGKGLYKWGSGDQFEGDFDAGKPTANGLMKFHIEPAAAAASAPANPAESEARPATAESGAAKLADSDAPSRQILCSKSYNSARTLVALRRFLEAFPDDECGRQAMARQKIALIEENERKIVKEREERAAQAKALVSLIVAYRQNFAHCVTGSGSGCQRVTYQFEVKGKIKEVDLGRQGVQLQIVEVVLLGSEQGADPQLVDEGRAAAVKAFRSSMVGTTQWKTKAEVGLAF